MLRKNITITEEQAAFVKERNINLSRLVQNVLDNDREDWEFYRRTQESIRDMDAGNYIELSLDEIREEICRLESLEASKKRSTSSATKRKSPSLNKSKKSRKTQPLASQ